MRGFPDPFPSELLELVSRRHPSFKALNKAYQHRLVGMLWDFANPAYRHKAWKGAAFSSQSQEKLWGNRRTRNSYVAEYFAVRQGGNIEHLMNAFAPRDFMGQALLEYLESPEPMIFRHLDGKKMASPRKVILSRASNNDLSVKHAKHSVWPDVRPSATVPINAQALQQFIQSVPHSFHQLHALRLLRLSRNTVCPGAIPVQYQQVSTGRLVEGLFYLQSTPKEVLSAAMAGFWDYDIKNAHFTIFSQWAKKLGKRTPVVDEYSQKKAVIREDLAKHCDAPEDDIKQCLLALLYGATLHPDPERAKISQVLKEEAHARFKSSPFVRRLRAEIKRVGNAIIDDLPKHWGRYGNALGIYVPKPQRNGAAVLLCHALQGVEARILKSVIARYGQDVLLPMHDGWVLRHRVDCNEFSSIAQQATGFDLEIEESQHPKHPPKEDGTGGLYFPSSAPDEPGGFVVSTAPQWAESEHVYGRNTRPDLLDLGDKAS